MALLYIRGDNASNVTPNLYLHEVYTVWNESTLTKATHANGAGEYYDAAAAYSADSYIWDITYYVNEWMNGTTNNFGFAITCDTDEWNDLGLSATSYVRLYEETFPDNGDDNETGGGTTTLPFITVSYVKNEGVENKPHNS